MKMPTRLITRTATNPMTSFSTMSCSGYGARAPCVGRSEAFDDGGVGHAAALAHRLQPVPAAGPLQLADQGGQQLGAGAAERVAQGDGTTVDVDPAHVGVELLVPRQ